MADYDIANAFAVIEQELIASMIRNMDRHRATETAEGIEWSMWQAEQLKALEKYKKKNQKKYRKKFQNINSEAVTLIREARKRGGMQQEIRILQAIKKGYKINGRNKSPSSQAMTGEFFKTNDRKLEALMKATLHDMEKAETSILRMANDQYRKAIFNAQVYANSGAGTYEKAVDMATKDMLLSGLNCVEYKNGARHRLSDYADMAIRTASKRAYLAGEGEKRQEWGISTVIMNKRGNPCPMCLPFVGKVLIDDVWSGGKSADGPYPLMSKAIAAGLYHPRCRDSHTTYFQGISTADDTWTQKELEAIEQVNRQESEQQYATRQAAKFGRLAENSLDKNNQKLYQSKADSWKSQLIDENEIKLPDEVMEIQGMTEDMRIEIEKAIEMTQKRYKIQLGTVSIESLGPENLGTLFVVGPYMGNNGKLEFALLVNSDTDYTSINKRISKRNKSGYFAARSLSDCVDHEMAHVMTFQNCNTIEEYRALKKKIDKQFIPGISGYADASGLGTEALAEAFVRMKNGEKVSLQAQLSVKKYIERWKK